MSAQQLLDPRQTAMPANIPVDRSPSSVRSREFDVETGFGSAYTPWIEAARAEVIERAAGASVDAGLARTIVESNRSNLLSRLGAIGGKTLLEQYRASAVGHDRFVDRLLADHWKSLIREFPVMGRLLALVTRQWVDATSELIERLGADAALLRRDFGFDAMKIEQLSAALGDPHNGGRSVFGIKDAQGVRVAYKPRAMAVEAAFAAVMEHVADAEATPQPRTMDRGSYGWMEWVDAEQACSPAEVDDFYRRVGSLIAVARVLSLSDLHLENLIASGPVPVVIDLECLITPHFHTASMPGDEGLRRFMRDSVMPSGLLPGTTPSFGSIAADRAGLSGLPGAVTGSFGRGWTNLATDAISVEPRPMIVGQATNRPLPTRGVRPIPALPTEAIIEGYEKTATLLDDRPFDLGLLDGVRPRVLFRSTQRYVDIIGSLFEPEALADPTLFAERVRGDEDWRTSLDDLVDEPVGEPVKAPQRAASGRRWQDALVDAEAAAMADLDVPAFTFDPANGEVDLGGELRSDLFRTRPLDDVARRMGVIGKDLDVQTSMLRIALQGHGVGTLAREARRSDVEERLDVAGSGNEDASVLSAAERIIDRIVQRVLRVEGRTRWLTTSPIAGGANLGPVLSGPGLYQGAAGTAVTLALASRHFDRPELADLARTALIDSASLLPLVDTPDVSPLDIWQLGGGRSGWAYSAAVVGASIDDADLIGRATEVLAELDPGTPIGRFDNLDLIGGWAGIALALDAVATMSGDQEVRSAAESVAESIAGEVERRFRERQVPHHARLSMAHGSFGIALALRRAGATSDRALEVSAMLEADQRSRITDRGGVPSRVYRDGADVRADTSWCWGTAGFLASLDADSEVADAVEVALDNCGHGGGEIDRLCCGSAGRLVALASLHTRLRTAPSVHERVASLVDHLTGAVTHERIVGDSALDFVDVSLFRGWAGIAYALMVAADPATVNVLRVDPVTPVDSTPSR